MTAGLNKISRGRRKGLTLVEGMISTVIISTMLVMVLNTFGSSVRAKKIRQAKSRGPALAQQLMAEILQADYADGDETPVFGREASETGNTRNSFDDVDDYHNWSASPQEKDGTAIANLSGWNRTVTVQYAQASDPTATSSSDQGIKRITITVTDPYDNKTSLVAIRSNLGLADQAPSRETTFLTWTGVELQIGSESADRVVSGTNILNKVAVE